MIRACEEKKRSLSIGYRCQHDPHTREYMPIGYEKSWGNVQLCSCISQAGAVASCTGSHGIQTSFLKANHDKRAVALGCIFGLEGFCMLGEIRYMGG